MNKEQKEKFKIYLKQYYIKNKKKINNRSLKYYYDNYERVREVKKKYNKENWDNYYKKNKVRLLEVRKFNLKDKVLEKRAWNKFKEAIRTGKIKRQPCEVCGELKTDGHHFDYNKPLEVIWLCRQHHCELHRNLRIDCKS